LTLDLYRAASTGAIGFLYNGTTVASLTPLFRVGLSPKESDTALPVAAAFFLEFQCFRGNLIYSRQ